MVTQFVPQALSAQIPLLTNSATDTAVDAFTAYGRTRSTKTISTGVNP